MHERLGGERGRGPLQTVKILEQVKMRLKSPLDVTSSEWSRLNAGKGLRGFSCFLPVLVIWFCVSKPLLIICPAPATTAVPTHDHQHGFGLDSPCKSRMEVFGGASLASCALPWSITTYLLPTASLCTLFGSLTLAPACPLPGASLVVLRI